MNYRLVLGNRTKYLVLMDVIYWVEVCNFQVYDFSFTLDFFKIYDLFIYIISMVY
jgi:hypothetical protein